MQEIQEYLSEVKDVLNALPFGKIEEFIHILLDAYEMDKNVFILGNGGSAATASHFCCDLAKGTALPGKKRFKAISLTDQVPLITAWANDTDYEHIFSQQLQGFLQPHDVVVGFTGSGNSRNVLNAFQYAREQKALTVGLTGFDGGKIKLLSDLCIVVPSNSMQQIEDAHLIIAHVTFLILKEKIEKR